MVHRGASRLIAGWLALVACGDGAADIRGGAPRLIGSAAPGWVDTSSGTQTPKVPDDNPSIQPPVTIVGTPVAASSDAGLGVDSDAAPRSDAGPAAPETSAAGSENGPNTIPDGVSPEPPSTEPKPTEPDTGKPNPIDPTPTPFDAGPTDPVSAPREDAGSVDGLPAGFGLAIIGSSTAAGDGASTQANSWVSMLEASLSARIGGSFELYNFAVGGITSAELLSGSGHPGNIEAAIGVEPDLIVVALAGSNDLSAGTTTSELLARLTLLRDNAFAAGIPVFFVSTAPKALSEPEREQLAAWSSDMAQTFGVCPVPGRPAAYSPCFIDIFAALADGSLGLDARFDSGDGIHVSDAGHALIYDIAQAIIEPYVCSRSACR